jgi:hypothetical protein
MPSRPMMPTSIGFFPGPVCDDGGKTALGKINAVDAPVRLLQDLADREINVFKVGCDEPKIAIGQTRQDKIGLAVCHGASLVGQERFASPSRPRPEEKRTMRNDTPKTPRE